MSNYLYQGLGLSPKSDATKSDFMHDK